MKLSQTMLPNIAKQIPNGEKQVLIIAGLLLILPGAAFGFGFVCLPLLLVIEGEAEAIFVGLIGFTFLALTLGAGGTIFWHSQSSLQNRPSGRVRLPSAWGMVGMFTMYVIIGIIIFQSDFAAGLFFPPTILIAVSLPPLLAVSWFINRQADGITWRRSMVAFAGSTLLGLLGIIMSQFLLFLIVPLLTLNPVKAMVDGLGLLDDFFSRDTGRFATDFNSLFFVIVQIGIVIPLTGVIVKPLIVLPLSGYLSRQKIFLVGTFAGAGFAALESIIFVGIWPQLWGAILVVQLFGGAVHLLGAGLLAVGWRDTIHRLPDSWPKWIARFGVAVALHILWNTGLFMFLIAITSQNYLEYPINDITVAFSLTVILLISYGLTLFWIGRSIAMQTDHLNTTTDNSATTQTMSFNQVSAVWAIAGIVAIVPLGILVTRVLLK